MSLITLPRDEFGLANELLPEAKAWLRVNHCDDDAQITMLIAAAMGTFERTRGVTLFPTTYVWTVDASFVGGFLNITPEQPITPISSWVASASGSDVSSAYSLRASGQHGVTFYSLVGEAQSGLGLTIVSGFASPDVMPATIKVLIFTLTSTYYEYREKFTPGNLERHPDWDNAEMAGFWVPRV